MNEKVDRKPILKAGEGIGPMEAVLIAALNGFTLEEVGLSNNDKNKEMLEQATESVAHARKLGAIIDIPV